ncbi:MAG: hypothetical protein CSB48_08405 [Proteobacteria bacterium]|nr:MAG: hypothetical protein CSB48_08405 [Pseudomonadota bacterium]PIE40286.1 MAG: hypothetical protein CSA51_01445 [Gammaproteobacteria bacterium]
MSELKLVTSLFNQQVVYTLDFLASLTTEDWKFISSPWDSFLFHGQARNVSIADIVKHVMTLEHSIIHVIKSLKSGSVVSLEGDKSLCKGLVDCDEIVPFYSSVHKENLKCISSFNQQDLDKTFTFINQTYTGSGLLWMTTGHHAMHFGHLRSIRLPGSNKS